MARKRNKRAHTPTHCAAAEPAPPRPRPYRPLTDGGTAVVVVVVVLTVALAAALVATGMSAGTALELVTGGCLLAVRLRPERV